MKYGYIKDGYFYIKDSIYAGYLVFLDLFIAKKIIKRFFLPSNHIRVYDYFLHD